MFTQILLYEWPFYTDFTVCSHRFYCMSGRFAQILLIVYTDFTV